MERVNTVLPNGTFGMAVSAINTNFSLIVSAINSLEYSSTKSKGIYDYGFTPSATTFPNAADGDWCMVLAEGNTFPATIWTFDGTTWSQGGTWNPDGLDLTGYATTTDMTAAITSAIAQAIAQMGYAEVTVSGTTLSASLQNYVLPTSGGTIHLKMSAPGTGASTLNINNTGAKELWYNGAAVSDGNTWEANEIISVFYDGTRYMASNSQGGGKADSQLDENSTMPVQNQAVAKAINAISANLQDVENKTYYTNEQSEINTTSMTKTAMSLGENKRWLNQGGNHHVVIPCEENDVFGISLASVTASGTGGFYGWLTSAYTTPKSQATVPYVTDCDRVWLRKDAGEVTITAPAGAAYLCLVTKDGSQHVCTWVGTHIRQESLRARIQDNVEPAIAENADAIAALNMKPSYAPSSYLPIKETHQRYMNVLGTQGSALYNDTLVVFYAASDGNRLRFYDLNTKQLLSSNLLPAFDNTRVHGNTLTFSNTFYDENDNFPLLYLCSGYTDTAEVSTSEVYVIRIANDTYSLSIVQTITLDYGIINKWTEFIVDNVKDRAWIMGSGIADYICVNLPSIANSAVTIDEDTAIIDKFNVPAFNLGNTVRSSGQGRFFYHNRIYHVSGIPQESGQGEFSTFVCVTNVLTHVIECVLPLVNFGLTNGTSNNYEPEGCFIWNDDFYVVFRGFVEKLIF